MLDGDRESVLGSTSNPMISIRFLCGLRCLIEPSLVICARRRTRPGHGHDREGAPARRGG
jgi:hypothetical protein